MDYKQKYLKYKRKYFNKKREIVLNAINNARIQYGGAAEVKSSHRRNLDHFSSLIMCPISLSVMIDPVMAQDGHTYEKTKITKWIKDNKNSPMTRAPMTSDFFPNIAIRNIIQKIVDEGYLNMDLVNEYLERQRLPPLEIRKRIRHIIANKLKNLSSQSFLFEEDKGYMPVNIKGINYYFSFTPDLLRFKRIFVYLDDKRCIELTVNLEDDLVNSEITDRSPRSFHYTPSNLDVGIIFSKDSKDEIVETLRQFISMDGDLYQTILPAHIEKFIVSPRLKIRPVLYAFMEYDINPLSNLLEEVKPSNVINRFPDLQTATANAAKGGFFLEGDNRGLHQMSYDAPVRLEEIISETYLLPFDTILGAKDYYMVGIVIEPNDISTETDYALLFTGESGVGKSYLAHFHFNDKDVFETDAFSKEEFLEKYKEKGLPKVIVVGRKDKTFNAAYIRDRLSITTIECRFIQFRYPNIEPAMVRRLGSVSGEEYVDESKGPVEEEDSKEPGGTLTLTAAAAATGQVYNPATVDRPFLVLMRTHDGIIPEEVYYDDKFSKQDDENEYHDLLFSDGKIISLKRHFTGERGEYTRASWGSVECEYSSDKTVEESIREYIEEGLPGTIYRIQLHDTPVGRRSRFLFVNKNYNEDVDRITVPIDIVDDNGIILWRETIATVTKIGVDDHHPSGSFDFDWTVIDNDEFDEY